MTIRMYFIGATGPIMYDDAYTHNGNLPVSYQPGAGKLTFVNDTFPYILDSTSGFKTAGFVPNDIIIVSGTGSNNGMYQILEVSDNKITLSNVFSLVNEVGTADTTIETKSISALLGEDVITVHSITGMVRDGDGDTTIAVEKNPDDDTIRFTAGGIEAATVTADGIKSINGTRIKEFSIDGTMAGNSDDAIPTEKAVRTYAEDAVNKAHDRKHSISSTNDHSSSITNGNIIVADSNGLPDDGGKSVSDVLNCDNHVSGSTNFVLKRASSISELNQTISDPPTQTEVQDISDKVDSIITALRNANVIST